MNQTLELRKLELKNKKKMIEKILINYYIAKISHMSQKLLKYKLLANTIITYL